MLASILNNKALNGWWLFSLIGIIVSAAVVYQMLHTNLSAGAGISELIGFSVRLAVPFIFLAMAASSFQVLFPSHVSKWWLRNRRYIGLCFAVGMAWQGLFILIISTIYRPYYLDGFLFRDEIEGSIGYLFLVAMVVTSFKLTRKKLDNTQWKIIHKGGTYFLWAYAFSVYWWALFYYEGPELHDYIYYVLGFIAFALRIAAWGKKRHQHAPSALSRATGTALVLAGLVVAVTGSFWQNTVTNWMTGPAWSAQLELWLPFWPLEPFYSLMLIAVGVGLLNPSTKPGHVIAPAAQAH